MHFHLPKRRLTTLYCLHQASYFFAIAGIGAFSVTYLMDKGFAASQIGLIVAMTNICSCALQPIIGSYVDRRSMSLLAGIILRFLGVALLSFISIEAICPPLAVTAVLFVIGSLTFSITVPLSSSLCAYYSQNDYHIDYGMGSGVGSLSFSFASLLIGYMIAARGSSFMMRFCLMFIVAQMFFMLRYPKIEEANRRAYRTSASSSLSLAAFCRRYRMFLLTLVGVMFLAACHAMAENYLIHLFTRLGGGSEHVGTALFIACITAAPFLLFFERIQRKTGVCILMRLAGLFYAAKAVLLILAPTIGSVYLIVLLQTCTYGFLYPPLYYFAGKCVSKADTAKGQTVASSLYTLGAALGSSLGGTVIDYFSLNAMYALAALIALAGTLLINLAISKADSSR
ncbi:MAG: MFS transporter [Clostridia bacterium]|nr:MFS transporter [Clostridia bacterium]